MVLQRGDVVLIPFPYVQHYRKGKTRSALVIQNNVANKYRSNVIIALDSSSLPSKRYPMHYHIDVKVETNSGLTANSVVKTETIITMSKRGVIRKLGFLSAAAMKQVNDCLRASLEL